jgi:hypothetical protein
MTEVAQIRITLADVTPEIWRRVLVPASITLAGLHAVIQAAMGWEDTHLHMFRIDGKRYGLPEDESGGREILDAARYQVSEVVVEGDRFLYVYDFGDDWRHEITIEGVRALAANETVPAILAGKRACPPEDCGGPYQYPEMLAALGDPDHEDHEHYLEWIGEFDAESFDLKLANKRLQAMAFPSRSSH